MSDMTQLALIDWNKGFMLEKDGFAQLNRLMALALCSLFFIQFAGANETDSVAASIAEVEGDAWLIRASNAQQQLTLVAGQRVFPGDTVVTGKTGKAALLLADESLIRLYHGSEFSLNAVAPSAGWLTRTSQRFKSSYELVKGELWFRNKRRGSDIEIGTEHVSISVRGTEFSVVAQLDVVYVTMLEGSIAASNSLGSVEAISGEQVVAERGKAPTKRLLLNPDNAVQWTIKLPDIFSSQSFAQFINSSSSELNNATADEQTALILTQAAATLDSGDYTDAFELLAADQDAPFNAPLQTYQAWAYIETGQPQQTIETLARVLSQEPNFLPAVLLNTLAALMVNNNSMALTSGAKGIAMAPGSAEAQLLESYAQQANFMLDAAYAAAAQAAMIAPDLAAATLQLTRLAIGRGEFDLALSHLADVAPATLAKDTDLLTTQGFALLAKGESKAAQRSFEQANQLNTPSADLALGQALIALRNGQQKSALERIASAVAMEPLEASYMNYFGRILYETKRFDKAIEVLERARQLDPNDPTPLYLLAIIKRDRNQDGEAIALLQIAEQLNDKRAVYRSRYVLDQDSAIKSVDLSLALQTFNFDAWAQHKAVNAIANDRANYSAHLLYAGALNQQSGRDTAFASEALKARLLQPANANTFNTFSNYTSVFDVPTLGGSFSNTNGSFDLLENKLTVYSAVPDMNIAVQASITDARSDGWRGTEKENLLSKAALVKWDIFNASSLLFSFNRVDIEQSDRLDKRFEFDSLSEPVDTRKNSLSRYELGLHHQFDAQTSYLGYASFLQSGLESLDQTNTSLGMVEINALLNTDIDEQVWITQNQFSHKMDKSQWMYGLFTYQSSADRIDINSGSVTLFGQASPLTLYSVFDINNERDRTQRTVYVHNQTQATQWLTVDAAAYWDTFENSDPFSDDTWKLSKLNPRLGLSTKINERNTLRIAAYRYLFSLVPGRIDPVDVAGLSIYRGSAPGTLTKEYNVAYENTWSKGFMQMLGIWAESETELRSFDGVIVNQLLKKSHRRGVEFDYNQLLNQHFGWSAQYSYLNINEDPELDTSRNEDLGELDLTFISGRGLRIQAGAVYRHARYDNRDNSDEFFIANLKADYTLKLKDYTARINAEFNNLFDENFNWVTDSFVIDGRIPRRNFRMTIEIGF